MYVTNPTRPIMLGIGLLIWSGFPVQTSCATSGADSGPKPAPQSIQSNDRYVVAGITLNDPVVITRAEVFTDGGTMELSFRDARGVTLDAFLDAGNVLESTPGEPDEPRVLSVGGPLDSPAAKRLELGGPDERELHRMLASCIDRASNDGAQLVRHDLGMYTDFKSDPERDRRRVMAFKAVLSRAPILAP